MRVMCNHVSAKDTVETSLQVFLRKILPSSALHLACWQVQQNLQLLPRWGQTGADLHHHPHQPLFTHQL